MVTLTIGGNDIGFGDIARNCYVADCTSELLNKADKIATMRDRVTRLVIPALKGAAPTAQVVIVACRRLLPVQQRDAVNCGWLEPGERVLLNTLVADINLALRKAAKAADAKYVDVTDALDGHEMCSRDSHVVRIYGNKFNSEQAHPNKDGQLDYAQAVFTGLKKLGINSR